MALGQLQGLMAEPLESARLSPGTLTPTRIQSLHLLQTWGGPLRSDPAGTGLVWLRAEGTFSAQIPVK